MDDYVKKLAAALQSPEAKPFVKGGMVGYQAPIGGGLMSGSLNNNKVNIGWQGQYKDVKFNADRKGNAFINYHQSW
jgi:hypothetical protein